MKMKAIAICAAIVGSASAVAIRQAGSVKACLFIDPACATPVPVVPGILDDPCMDLNVGSCSAPPVAVLPIFYNIDISGSTLTFGRYSDDQCAVKEDESSKAIGKCHGPLATMSGVSAYAIFETSGAAVEQVVDTLPVVDAVAEDTAVVDAAAETDVVDDTVVDDTVVDDTVVDDTVVDTAVVDDTTVVDDTAVIDDTVYDDTVVDDTLVDSAVVDTPAVDDTFVDTPVVDDTVVDATLVDDSIVAETMVAEPIPEEPLVVEPVVMPVPTPVY